MGNSRIITDFKPIIEDFQPEIMPVNQIRARVVDYGYYVPLAVHLAKTFKEVSYCNPGWVSSFPNRNQADIGSGFDLIKVVHNMLEDIEDVDLFIFPEIGQGHDQIELEKMGKLVWGSKLVEEYEWDRVMMKKWQEKQGLPVGPWKEIIGTVELRKFLKENKDWWVKICKWRGYFETFKSTNYTNIESVLDDKERKLGDFKYGSHFLVEQNLKKEGIKVYEGGIDTWIVNGQHPSKLFYGMEIKDSTDIGMMVDYEDIPDFMRTFTEAFIPVMKDGGYCNLYSTEELVGEDHKAMMFDPCLRFPSPPYEFYLTNYTNFPEIISRGAAGECIEPEYKKTWMAAILFGGAWPVSNWQNIKYPSEYEDYIHIKYGIKRRGNIFRMPQVENAETSAVGTIVGLGDTLKEAKEMATEIAKSIEGYGLDIPIDDLDTAEEELEKAKELGAWVKK